MAVLVAEQSTDRTDVRRTTAARSGAGQLATALVAGLLVLVASAGMVTLLDPDPTDLTEQQRVLAMGAAVVFLVLGIGLRFATRAAAWIAGVVGGVCGSMVLAQLNGTKWGLWGLQGDAGFRTQLATRFADTPHLVDSVYQGVPGFYPPLSHWLLGRTAVALGIPAWETLKWAQISMAVLIPIATFLLWRRLVGPGSAACITSLVSLYTAIPSKPDEWVALALLVPWWIGSFRRVTGRPRTPRSLLAHGLVAGLFFLDYTFYLLPLAVATMLGAALDLRRGNGWCTALVRPLLVGLVGLAVAAPSWVPQALRRLRGAPADDLQLRWHEAASDQIPLPLPTSVLACLLLLGLVWCVWRRTAEPSAEPLLLLVAASYLTLLVSRVAVAHGHPFLGSRAADLLRYALLAGAGCAIGAWVSRPRPAGRRPWVEPVLLALAVPVAFTAAVAFLQQAGAHVAAVAAQGARYPAGGAPAFLRADDPNGEPFESPPSGPTASSLVKLIGSGMSTSHPVVVTSRVDLLATTPMFGFTTWSAHYSNPLGRFDERIRFLQRLAVEPRPAAVHRLLRHNAFSPVDALVLRHAGGRYEYRFVDDNFPNGVRVRAIALRPAQFASPLFRVERLPGWVVITLTDAPSTAAAD